ncbi:unnamed protein product [Allacma fusca]|uniref:Mediator of RNA polymerase II transcription subunit 24 n=1 Tax=Allacma fusca TaxID=39272 RepID=A0A8J2PZS7_9HEXA|nr:unnamed protein product [Allacma fusca]
MVLFGVSSTEQPKVPVSRESRTKNIIIKAWRERWTDVQWGIHVRSLMENDADASFIADCLLQQALTGPGPNSLVLSYLLHSFYSQIISSAAVLKSISLYDGYHKPFCIGSLLDLIDNIKERLVVSDHEDTEECLQLAISIEAVIHWLLACMYSSLENLSDLAASEEPVEEEDSKIVTKSRKLIEFFFGDPYLRALLHIAIVEDPESYDKIKRMCAEVAKFAGGSNAEDIAKVLLHIDQLKNFREENVDKGSSVMTEPMDGLQMMPINGSIHAILMTAALLRSCKDLHTIVTDLLIVKQLKSLKESELYCEIAHSSMLGLVDAIGKEQELKFIGFTFLQLPVIFRGLRERLNGNDDLVDGLNLFVTNESVLDIVDAKLHCSALDLLLTSLHKIGLITEGQKLGLLAKKGTSNLTQKSNSSNAVLILKAESTLSSVLKTFDGDFVKNQEAILGVMCDMLGKNFELILAAASTTGALQQVTSRLIKLNQFSRQVKGEGTNASTSRAMIFDISFLMLCHTVQTYGAQSLESTEPDCFFEEWYQNCMVEENTAKNPDGIIARCDQSKVDVLLNQYLQGDTELKTSLVFWHEVCTNAVGVVQNLLLAWENGAVSFADVKKILDVFRSRICALPVCISAWLCAYIQVMPEEQCGKARYILDHFKNPMVAEESQEYFKERCAMMSGIISKMMKCIHPSTTKSSQNWCITESKPASELLEGCWKSMASRGLVDMETTLNLKNLMEMSGHAHFIQFIIQEMFQLQYTLNLMQWCDCSYGVLQMDLKNCTEALISHVLPSVIRFSMGSQYFVEPQLMALVTLSVDCILSYYLQGKSNAKIKPEPMDIDEGEPSAKRRKLFFSNTNSKSEINGGVPLDVLLKDLYDEFENIVCNKYESSPQVVFILRFLQQMCSKSPDLSLLHSTSNKLINRLMSLLHEEISSTLLLGLYNMSDKTGRKNCAQAICNLKSLQQGDDTT